MNTEINELLGMTSLIKVSVTLICILFSALICVLIYIWQDHKKEIKTDRAEFSVFTKEMSEFVLNTSQDKSRVDTELKYLRSDNETLKKKTDDHSRQLAIHETNINSLKNK